MSAVDVSTEARGPAAEPAQVAADQRVGSSSAGSPQSHHLRVADAAPLARGQGGRLFRATVAGPDHRQGLLARTAQLKWRSPGERVRRWPSIRKEGDALDARDRPRKKRSSTPKVLSPSRRVCLCVSTVGASPDAAAAVLRFRPWRLMAPWRARSMTVSGGALFCVRR